MLEKIRSFRGLIWLTSVALHLIALKIVLTEGATKWFWFLGGLAFVISWINRTEKNGNFEKTYRDTRKEREKWDNQ